MQIKSQNERLIRDLGFSRVFSLQLPHSSIRCRVGYPLATFVAHSSLRLQVSREKWSHYVRK